MNIDNKTFADEIEQFRAFASGHPLPRWDALPNLELYVDQVIVLINRYLGFCDRDGVGEDSAVLTHAMINNYVKQKTIPMPVKKRYSRIHLACLIMVVALKQSLSISTIQTMLPGADDEAAAKGVYNSFVDNWENAFGSATEKINDYADRLLQTADRQMIEALIVKVAVSSNVFKLFTEKMIALCAEPAAAQDSAPASAE